MPRTYPPALEGETQREYARAACDPLVELIDKQVAVRLDLLPLPLTPIETAIAEADDDRSEGNSVLVPSAGRRRNGTRSSEQE